MADNQTEKHGLELLTIIQQQLGTVGQQIGELQGTLLQTINGELGTVGAIVEDARNDIDTEIIGTIADAGDTLVAVQRQISSTVDGLAAELQTTVQRIDDPELQAELAVSRVIIDPSPPPHPPHEQPWPPAPHPEHPTIPEHPQHPDFPEHPEHPEIATDGVPGPHPPHPVHPAPPSHPPHPAHASHPPHPPHPEHPEIEVTDGTGTRTCPNCLTICGPTASCPCGVITPRSCPTGTTPPPDDHPHPTGDGHVDVFLHPHEDEEQPSPSFPIFPSGSIKNLCSVDAFATGQPPLTLEFAGNVAELARHFLGIVPFGDVFNLRNPATSLIGGAISEFLGSFIGGLADGIKEILDKFAEENDCESLGHVRDKPLQIALGFITQYFSPEFRDLYQSFTYQVNQQCPTLFPDQNEATDAFLAGVISPKILESWVNINKYCSEPWDKIVQSRRSKIRPNELVALRLREIISKSEYERLMRQLGFLNQSEYDQLFALSEQIPGVGELIRFMVRDVADVAIVQEFDLDTEFEEKWTGDVKDWSLKQGITEKFARNSWRAHWIIPGPSQLFEMFHRLRTDKDIENIRVTEETLRTALKQQDVLPFWVDRFIKISFRPLTRRDIRRAFDIGSITKDEVFEANIQLGYSDENAQTLTDFAIDNRNERIGNEKSVKLWLAEAIDRAEVTLRLTEKKYEPDLIESALDDQEVGLDNSLPVKLHAGFKVSREEAKGLLTDLGVRETSADKWLARNFFNAKSHPAVKQYERGIIDEPKLRDTLFKFGIDGAEIREITLEADHEIQLDFNKDCIRAIEKRFMLGELLENEVLQELRAIGITNKFGNEHLRAFLCKRSVSGKMPATQTLCEWFDLGIITENEYFQRLQNIGWEAEEAANIFITCSTRIGIKRQKVAEKREKERVAEQKRAAREAERLRKQREQQLKGRAKALEKSVKTKDRRDLALIKCVEKLVKKTEDPLPVAFDIVRGLKLMVQNEFVLNVDDALASVCKAIESPKFPDDQPLESLAREFADSFAKLDASGTHGNGKAVRF